MINRNFKISIENIEKNRWEDLAEYPTNLVKRIHEIRKKNIIDFDLDDYRIALDQNVGVNILMPIVIEILKKDIMTKAMYYPTDLLEAALRRESYWKNNDLDKQTFKIYLSANKHLIAGSDEITDEIRDKILQLVNKFLD